MNRWGAIYIANSGQANNHNRFVIRDNIIAGLGSSDPIAVWVEYAPTALDMDFDVFSPGATFS